MARVTKSWEEYLGAVTGEPFFPWFTSLPIFFDWTDVEIESDGETLVGYWDPEWDALFPDPDASDDEL